MVLLYPCVTRFPKEASRQLFTPFSRFYFLHRDLLPWLPFDTTSWQPTYSIHGLGLPEYYPSCLCFPVQLAVLGA